MMYNMKDIEFWLDYMQDHYMNVEHTWEWAFFYAHDGAIHVRHGPLWHDTGIYAQRRTIRGCVWE